MEVLWIKPSANGFSLEEFNFHHKDWLTHSGGTDRFRELCYDFSISNGQTFQLRSLTVTLTVLLFWMFLSSDASICSTMALSPVGNFFHVSVLVSIDVLSNSEGNAPYKGYDYSCVDCDGLRDHFRDEPWENIFKLGACGTAAGVNTDIIFEHC